MSYTLTMMCTHALCNTVLYVHTSERPTGSFRKSFVKKNLNCVGTFCLIDNISTTQHNESLCCIRHAENANYGSGWEEGHICTVISRTIPLQYDCGHFGSKRRVQLENWQVANSLQKYCQYVFSLSHRRFSEHQCRNPTANEPKKKARRPKI